MQQEEPEHVPAVVQQDEGAASGMSDEVHPELFGDREIGKFDLMW